MLSNFVAFDSVFVHVFNFTFNINLTKNDKKVIRQVLEVTKERGRILQRGLLIIAEKKFILKGFT